MKKQLILISVILVITCPGLAQLGEEASLSVASGQYSDIKEEIYLEPGDFFYLFADNIDGDLKYNLSLNNSDGKDYGFTEIEFRETTRNDGSLISRVPDKRRHIIHSEFTSDIEEGSYEVLLYRNGEQVNVDENPVVETSGNTMLLAKNQENEAESEIGINAGESFQIIAEEVRNLEKYNISLRSSENNIYGPIEKEFISINQVDRSGELGQSVVEISTAENSKFDSIVEEGSYDLILSQNDEEIMNSKKSLVVAEPVSGRFGHPSGVNEWNHHRYLSDVSREEAAALSAVDIEFLDEDFGPLSTSRNMTIGEIVNKTRETAKQNGWILDIQRRMGQTAPNGYENNGLLVTPQGDVLTDNTPNRDIIDLQSASENVEFEDDCYRGLNYRPRDHLGFPNSENGNEESYECPNFFTETFSNIIPSTINAEDYCPSSMTRSQCVEYKIRPTCEELQNGESKNPGEVCQAILTDTVSGSEDFGEWRNYCNQNFNEGGVKLNTSEVVNCMTGCYGYNGVANDGSFRKAPEASSPSYLTCGDVVQSFCEDTRYATYVSETTETHDMNTCRVTG